MAPIDLPKEIVLADTATKLGDAARGGVIVTGSHGGRYAAYLTLTGPPACRRSTTTPASAGTRRASPYWPWPMRWASPPPPSRTPAAASATRLT